MPNTPVLAPNLRRENYERSQMSEPPYILDTPSKRETVLQGLRYACERSNSTLWAAHIRTEHVHVVLDTEVKVERAMTDLKARATRKLREAYPGETRRHYWARHGSTRYVYDRDSLQAAITYVVEEQGNPMAVYLNENW